MRRIVKNMRYTSLTIRLVAACPLTRYPLSHSLFAVCYLGVTTYMYVLQLENRPTSENLHLHRFYAYKLLVMLVLFIAQIEGLLWDATVFELIIEFMRKCHTSGINPQDHCHLAECFRLLWAVQPSFHRFSVSCVPCSSWVTLKLYQHIVSLHPQVGCPN
jgi:hypothetical protein